MSEHLIAEANRHAKALPKMTLPTTKPNDLDLAWYRRECELLQDRNEALERENAALREDKERLDWVIKDSYYHFFFKLSSDLEKGRRQIDAARKEAQP